ncbi:eukaryotic translation initiation factor 4E-binding protein 1-like [Perognathus longimembris pacificus]|uniref:eukaryotic translation initiation factor 4E-binding protein 1-like n=1 Tax=Perognathus longimembris pacificus TaxID=214514 RepID=UPI002018FF93|nr:eukaryotic translation initiation factor 4E-binding protein 1-like [Perognathus longimembris pacificus]
MERRTIVDEMPDLGKETVWRSSYCHNTHQCFQFLPKSLSSQTPSWAIPTTGRVVLGDGVQPPRDYSTTRGSTLFSTTPGGTRIIYDRKFLMEGWNSPVARTPPRDLPTIPRVTSPTSDELPVEASQTHLPRNPEEKQVTGEESQFEMDI